MIYAGIGSRRTPADVLSVMESIGEQLARAGWTLRSGAADGADSAFERGCDRANGKKEIFLPWPGFNGSTSPLNRPSQAALALAADHHPAWHMCSRAATLLHARNMHQILGIDLKTPVDMVICWSPGHGGTEQALRLARAYGIHIVNLATTEFKL